MISLHISIYDPLIPTLRFERAYSSVIILLLANVLIPPFKVETCLSLHFSSVLIPPFNVETAYPSRS